MILGTRQSQPPKQTGSILSDPFATIFSQLPLRKYKNNKFINSQENKLQSHVFLTKSLSKSKEPSTKTQENTLSFQLWYLLKETRVFSEGRLRGLRSSSPTAIVFLIFTGKRHFEKSDWALAIIWREEPMRM